MKKLIRHDTIGYWLFWECTIITIASVMTYATVEFVRNNCIDNSPYDPIYALGMIVPMSIVVGGVSYLFNKRFDRHISGLTDGLRRVAEGDFSVQIDSCAGNPLSVAYEDFNKMARELGSVQTLREDFINNFSHEFKTPITAIRGFAELLQEPDLTEEDRLQYLQIIAEESARLAELSNNTLFLSKLESQQFVVDKAPFSLDEQIKRCAILLSHQWEAKLIAFSADLQEDVTYNGNEELMRHVWLNLLSNAIRYTPEGGEVSVDMKATDGQITVSVSDTGIGMNEEVRSHVFDKYFQGDPSHTGKGLGLGLSIVHRIVELCEGNIVVTSTPGQGSVFTVTLGSRFALCLEGQCIVHS